MIPNRHMCEVLDEMRKCCETGNYSYLPGLIEEVQSMGNRMEAKLWDQDDYSKSRAEHKKLKKQIKKLKETKDEISNKQ